MFTGIVAAVGAIAAVVPKADGLRLLVAPGRLELGDVGIGDSIAVNGCCLTVVDKSGEGGRTQIAFDVSAETLRCTVGLDGQSPADRLGGHLMTGHVDGVGTVVAFAPVAAPGPEQGSWRLEIEAPPELARFIATKGSIAVQGVSLTVNGVAGARFHVNLIPHTLEVTTLTSLGAGARVNLEVDLIARYVARLNEG